METFLDNPEYVEINGELIKINTDFRVALKCQEIALDKTIGDYERALAIIYTLYGDKGLEHKKDYDKLLELGMKYLKCGEELDETSSNNEPDMDMLQDFKLIEASFKSDYGITLSNEKMHWWDFFMYLNGLTDKCVLNRVREIRTYDLSTVKDTKERKKLEQAKKRYQLKRTEEKVELTDEQKQNVENFYKLTGIKRKE